MWVLVQALLRAAAVTEKASRVAPLVNSWKFQAAWDAYIIGIIIIGSVSVLHPAPLM